MTIFTDSERSTLELLYPNRDEWFEFFYLLSDRVQEQDELLADGMRFLCENKQRPFGSEKGKYWWLSARGKPFGAETDYYANYIPFEIEVVHFKESPDGILLVIEFLHKWAALSSDVRHRLWSEWGGVTV